MRKIKGYKNIDCQYFEIDEQDDSPKEFGCWSGILTIYEDDFFMGVVKNFNKQNAPELVIGNYIDGKVISLVKFDYLSEKITPELYDSADPDQGGKLYSGNYEIMHEPDDFDTGYSYITLNDLQLTSQEQKGVGETLSEAVEQFSHCNQNFVKQLFNSIITESQKDIIERLNFTYNLYSCANPELADACVVTFILNQFLGAENEFSDLIAQLESLPQLKDLKKPDDEKYSDIGEIIAGLGLVTDDDDLEFTDEEAEAFAELLEEQPDPKSNN